MKIIRKWYNGFLSCLKEISDKLRTYNGAISASPVNQLGLKENENSCSDRQPVNRDLDRSQDHRFQLKTRVSLGKVLT